MWRGRVIVISLFCTFMLTSLYWVGCSKDDKEELESMPVEENTPENGISTTIPSSLGNFYTTNFNRYTHVKAPNGGAIHIVAQNQLSDEQIIRCRSILNHYLENYPGSQYGFDKSEVANLMARRNAILCLLNGENDGENPIADEVTGQPLYQNEIQVEGHSWYVNQDYNHRDAAFEEILHFVHDNGIGVDGEGGNSGAMMDYQAEIRAAQENALQNNLWGINSAEWIQELSQENSLSQEYLAALIDSYYGLWGAWQESETHGIWGIYTAKNREEIASEDPFGNRLLKDKFFHPYLTYNARIDSNFMGVFSLRLDLEKAYTHHSQYLKDITLLGSNNNSIRVNQMNNDLTGNAGVNTVIFTGNYSEYVVNTVDAITTVSDHVENRDGVNTLRNIEKLQFADINIDL